MHAALLKAPTWKGVQQITQLAITRATVATQWPLSGHSVATTVATTVSTTKLQYKAAKLRNACLKYNN